MKPRHVCLALLFAIPLLASNSVQPVFAAEAVTSPEANEPEPAILIALTAGTTLTEGYRVFKETSTGHFSYVLYDAMNAMPASLPAGLSFDQNSIIHGNVPVVEKNTPATIYTLRITDANGHTRSKKIYFKINPALNVSIEVIRLTADSNIIVPIYPFKISGGTGNTEITFLSPNSMAIRTLDGLIFGKEGGITGHVPSNAQMLEGIQVRITDAGGAQIIRDVKWNINPPLIATTTNLTLTMGSEISPNLFPIKVEGGTPALRFKLFENDGKTVATLPSGVEFNEITGNLAGRVNTEAPMQKYYVIKVSDQGGGTLNVKFKLTVIKQPA